MLRPLAVVIAGPNGSGKSTLTADLREGSFPFPDSYINADEIAVSLRAAGAPDPEYAAFVEGRRLRQVYREQRRSFAYETVLSHPSGILDLQRLRDAGYHVVLVVVTTRHPRINVQRVSRRVLTGGHDVPASRITSRYERCMQLLPRAIETAHDAWVYDSTDELSLVMLCRDGVVFRRAQTPRYVASKIVTPLRERAAERQLEACVSVSCRVDENAGDYQGPIKWLGRHHSVQESLSIGPVLHDRCMLTGQVGLGETVRISYREGAGSIIGV